MPRVLELGKKMHFSVPPSFKGVKYFGLASRPPLLICYHIITHRAEMPKDLQEVDDLILTNSLQEGGAVPVYSVDRTAGRGWGRVQGQSKDWAVTLGGGQCQTIWVLGLSRDLLMDGLFPGSVSPANLRVMLNLLLGTEANSSISAGQAWFCFSPVVNFCAWPTSEQLSMCP